MARFLIFGSVAWDRPIWLDRSLVSGGRIQGLIGSEGATDIAAGRLGGAGANASACLKNAGHDVAVWSALRKDAVGQKIRRQLEIIGIETVFLMPAPPALGETFVLIEPSGERTIVFQHTHVDLDRQMRRALKQNSAPVSLSDVEAFAPDGIHLRSLFTGSAALCGLHDVVSVAHWPQSVTENSIAADILIGSKDDLPSSQSPDETFRDGQKACGGRLKWMILTAGERGGTIYSEDQEIEFSSVEVSQIDATGAGDAFAAGVLEAYTAGADIVEAARHGAQWGAATAGLRGCAELRPSGTYAPWAAKTSE